MFRNDPATTHVVEKGPPPTKIVPFTIPMGIIDHVMNNRYEGDGSVHPSEHLLYIKELCELFKIAGVSSEVIMRKIFSLSLKDKARDWYVLLDDSHLLDYKDLMSLFYSNFILFMKCIKIGIIYITFGLLTKRELLKLGED